MSLMLYVCHGSSLLHIQAEGEASIWNTDFPMAKEKESNVGPLNGSF